MVDNQHKKISGFRDLTEEEIEIINAIKAVGQELGQLIDTLGLLPNVDKRWLAIAKTDLQKGFMAAVRAVAKPEGF